MVEAPRGRRTTYRCLPSVGEHIRESEQGKHAIPVTWRVQHWDHHAATLLDLLTGSFPVNNYKGRLILIDRDTLTITIDDPPTGREP